MKYVIADIHGEYEKFMKMLELIDFKPEDKLYVLGDAIDRGSEPIKVLSYIMRNSANMEMILGNHEEMMLQSIVNKDGEYFSCWMQNGGAITQRQFLAVGNIRKNEILDYLIQLKLSKKVDNYILVHAGVDFQSRVYQDKETLLWARDEFISSTERFKDITVIFGHTPTYFMQPELPMKIWKKHDGKIGIDCGVCFKGGQLGCLRLDDMAEFYV